MTILRRAATAALAIVAMVALAPASADDAVTLRANIVGFEGYYRGPGRLTTTTICNQVYYNGTGTGIFPCTITFTIDRGTDVCDIAAGDVVGLANYESRLRPELDRDNVPLTGADFGGSGVVEGVVQHAATDIFTVRISFASICDGEQPTRKFVGDGHLV